MKLTGIHLLTTLGCLIWSHHAVAQPPEKAQGDNPSAARPDETPLAPDEVLQGIRTAAEKVVTAFNAGNAGEVAHLFLPDGEWIDEQGNPYQGRERIKEILTRYFEKYPGAKIGLEVESVRVIGPLAIEEGIRTMSAGANAPAVIRYVAILTRTDSGWQYASVKDSEQETASLAQLELEPLGWLVGDWVNEGPGAVVKIHYEWSENRNFLLGEYLVEAQGNVIMKTTHRIGWDALHHHIRSWLFDSDGGIGEGNWHPVGETWQVNSTAILPDGRTGSALVTLTPEGTDRFTMRGTNRFVGGIHENDFELKVVRRAPQASSEVQPRDSGREDTSAKPATEPQP